MYTIFIHIYNIQYLLLLLFIYIYIIYNTYYSYYYTLSLLLLPLLLLLLQYYGKAPDRLYYIICFLTNIDFVRNIIFCNIDYYRLIQNIPKY